MKIGIFAVGRMKSGPDNELAGRYLDRFAKAGRNLGLEYSGVTEIAESRAVDAPTRKSEEARQLLERMPADAIIIALDETGSELSSRTFARKLAAWRDNGTRETVLVIGGPDGHSPEMRNRATLSIRFGSMTWPHQLVRIMAAEQLYRAATILSGHPYHRQ